MLSSDVASALSVQVGELTNGQMQQQVALTSGGAADEHVAPMLAHEPTPHACNHLRLLSNSLRMPL